MALCSVCSHVKAREINARLLQGARIKATAEQYGFTFGIVRHHRRYCLPWRSAKTPKPITIDEQLADLKFESERLQFLGEAGVSITGAIQAVKERRALLELEARMEHRTGASHAKLFPPSPPAGQEFSVEFRDGRPVGVVKSAGR